MKKIIFLVSLVLLSLCSCGITRTPILSSVNSSNPSPTAANSASAIQSPSLEKKTVNAATPVISTPNTTTTASSIANSTNQGLPSKQATGPEFAFSSINQYITYNLPATLVDGSYNRELGYLGGNLFCRRDNGSCVAKNASDSTPPGWNSYGGAELYYKLRCKFANGQLTKVFLPWNHSIDLTDAEPLSDCAMPAVIVKIGFDLYTAPESQQLNIAKDKQNSTMWYVFFAKEDSEISYAVFLNAENYSKEETITLARSVKFSADAFNLVIR